MITEFEQDLPLQSVQSLINMIRTRQLDKKEFGLALLNVESYAMGKTLDSTRLFGASAPTHDPSDEEAYSALSQLEAEPGTVALGAGGHAALVILRWALKKYLTEFL